MSSTGELVSLVDEIVQPVAVRYLFGLHLDMVVPPVLADLRDVVEARVIDRCSRGTQQRINGHRGGNSRNNSNPSQTGMGIGRVLLHRGDDAVTDSGSKSTRPPYACGTAAASDGEKMTAPPWTSGTGIGVTPMASTWPAARAITDSQHIPAPTLAPRVSVSRGGPPTRRPPCHDRKPRGSLNEQC